MRIPKISDALLALRLLGPRLFLQALRNLLYSKTPYLVFVNDLQKQYSTSPKEISLSLASPEDAAQFFHLINKESRKSRSELLERKRFYEKGFHNCYIGRTINSKEMCCILWLVTKDDIEKTRSEEYYPRLKQDEVFAENMYTLEKFRGKGISNSSGLLLAEIAREKGFKRAFHYTAEDNIPSVRSNVRRGHLLYKRVLFCRFFYQFKIKTIHQFDPPIPMSRRYRTPFFTQPSEFVQVEE